MNQLLKKIIYHLVDYTIKNNYLTYIHKILNKFLCKQ